MVAAEQWAKGRLRLYGNEHEWCWSIRCTRTHKLLGVSAKDLDTEEDARTDGLQYAKDHNVELVSE